MNFKEKTDTELATLLIRDNEAAFSELYVRYKDKLYYFLPPSAQIERRSERHCTGNIYPLVGIALLYQS